MKTIVWILIISAIVHGVTLQAWGQTCTTPGTTVFFANGVNNDQGDALESTLELRTQLRSHVIGTPVQSECLKFALAYNHNEAAFLDFFEAADQVLGEVGSTFWRFWANLDPVPDWFQQTAQDIASGIDAGSFVNDADLQNHVKLYRIQILGGNKVVVVGHSQGNLYANAAYNILVSPEETNSFGIVSVATPASSVAGGQRFGALPYTTLLGDFIWLVLGALAANTFDFCGDDLWLCHSFTDTYLRGSTSRPQILNDIVRVILGLQRRPFALVRFVSLVEGNPGIPGDGVFVGSVGGVDPQLYELSPVFLLANATDGITVTVFPRGGTAFGPDARSTIQVNGVGCGAFVMSKASAPLFGVTVSEPTVNGVTGFAMSFPRQFIENGVGCPLNSLQIQGFFFFIDAPGGPIFLPSVDAVAVGLAQGATP